MLVTLSQASTKVAGAAQSGPVSRFCNIPKLDVVKACKIENSFIMFNS